MKTILSIISILTCSGIAQETATGDYVFRKKIAGGYESVNITPENGKVLGWTTGELVNQTISGGAWGSITGAISSQTDLNTALGLKVDDSQLSTNGGDNKVLQLDSAGNLRLGVADLPFVWAENSIVLRDGDSGISRIWWVNENGSDGASMFYNQEHSGSAELQINGPRIALCLNHHGLIQLGLSRDSTSTQSIQVQVRGEATTIKPAVRSLPIQFNSRVWNGSASIAGTQPFMVAEPTGTGSDVNLDFYNPGVSPNEAGGYESGTLAMRLSKDGLSLPTQTITDTNAVITKPLGDARYLPRYDFQSADQTFTPSSTGLQDTEIAITLAASTSYKIEVVASYSIANATHGVQHKLTYSGTMASKGGMLLLGNNGTPANLVQIIGTSGSEGYHNPVYINGGSNTSPLVNTVVVYTTTTGGILKLQGAQAVSGASNTVLKAGAWITATPLP